MASAIAVPPLLRIVSTALATVGRSVVGPVIAPSEASNGAHHLIARLHRAVQLPLGTLHEIKTVRAAMAGVYEKRMGGGNEGRADEIDGLCRSVFVTYWHPRRNCLTS